jgi:hypothetical protein
MWVLSADWASLVTGHIPRIVVGIVGKVVPTIHPMSSGEWVWGRVVCHSVQCVVVIVAFSLSILEPNEKVS